MKIPRKTAAVSLSAGWGEMGTLILHDLPLPGSLSPREMGPALKCIATKLLVKVLHQATPAAPDLCITLALQNLRGDSTRYTYKGFLQLQSSSFSPFSTHVAGQAVILYSPVLAQFQGEKNTQENPAKILK